MRTLITGANGFLGGVLVRRFSSENREVIALVRRPAEVENLAGPTVKIVQGDVTQPDSLAGAMTGVNVVLHLAGLRRASERKPFFDVNAEGTRTVCEAMLKAGARRLVLASSLAVHGPSIGGRAHVETDPYAPTEWYGESKVEAEKIALSYADRLEVVIVRPPRIMGPGDHENLPFFKIVKKGLALKLMGPPRRLSLVDVDDCADLFLITAEHPKAAGEAFLGPGPRDVTLEEIQAEAAKALGHHIRKVPVPQTLLRGAGALADVIASVTGKPLAINRKMAAQLLAPGWTASAQKALDLLGWTPRIGPVESIHRTARWYQDHGWI